MNASPIATMFDDIAPHYDRLNHLMALRLDRRWRRRTSKLVSTGHPTAILDVATGTADLALQLAKDNPQAQITGVDLSEKMLELGRQKVEASGLGKQILLMPGDAAALPFSDNQFDLVTVAFGVRNFERLEQGLQELIRVTRAGGTLAILEFVPPKKGWAGLPYRWYEKQVLPRVGRLVSGHPTAYSYLPDSIERFWELEALDQRLESLGVADLRQRTFTGGIVGLTYGHVQKNASPLQ